MPSSPSDYMPGSPGSPEYVFGGPTTPEFAPPQRGQPTTPEFSPPPPPTLMESAMNTITGLFKGGAKEPVYYRGSEEMGLPPNHRWQVKRIGDQFITIQTDDMPGASFTNGDSTLSFDGKPSPDNPRTPTLVPRSGVLTMVVHPSEIIPCSAVSEPEFFRDYMPYGSQNPPSQNNTQHMNPMSGLQPGNGNGGIQFNPVIKIVNGDDNSRNQGKPVTEMSNSNSNSANDDWGEMDGGNANNPIKFKETAVTSSQKEESPSGGGGGLFGGFKDFIIKKLT
jgi:hypothetical protein